MKNKLLPIGSVITLVRKPESELMIVAYFDKEMKINDASYDYACCTYPYGMGKDAILIKKEDIFEVKFIGYQNENFNMFKEKFEGVNNG